MTSDFQNKLKEFCSEMVVMKTEYFGNGRTIRNLFERCIGNQASRVVLLPNPSTDELMTLIADDLSLNDIHLAIR
jgi:hypothetical protein